MLLVLLHVCQGDDESERGYLRATMDRRRGDGESEAPSIMTPAEMAAMEKAREQEKFRRIQEEREAAFEAKLAKLNEAERRKEKQKKKSDAKIVKKVLKAAQSENPYAILGLTNWEIHIPERFIRWGKLSVRIPSMVLFRIPSKAIRKKYRVLATKVHPDKNRDGRATEAFIAVENAVSTLSDETERAHLDSIIMKSRQDKVDCIVRVSNKVVHRSSHTVLGVTKFAHRFVRPFAVPTLIISSLLI
jgi:hypothetical protein